MQKAVKSFLGVCTLWRPGYIVVRRRQKEEEEEVHDVSGDDDPLGTF